MPPLIPAVINLSKVIQPGVPVDPTIATPPPPPPSDAPQARTMSVETETPPPSDVVTPMLPPAVDMDNVQQLLGDVSSLLALVNQMAQEIAALKPTVAQHSDDIARLQAATHAMACPNHITVEDLTLKSGVRVMSVDECYNAGVCSCATGQALDSPTWNQNPSP